MASSLGFSVPLPGRSRREPARVVEEMRSSARPCVWNRLPPVGVTEDGPRTDVGRNPLSLYAERRIGPRTASRFATDISSRGSRGARGWASSMYGRVRTARRPDPARPFETRSYGTWANPCGPDETLRRRVSSLRRPIGHDVSRAS